MIGIISYGAGNLKSLHNALAWLGAEALLAERPEQLDKVSAVILPGVGAFGPAIARLGAAGFVTFLRDWARAGKPLFGICLGMQLLARESEEGGLSQGLGLVEGRIVRMKGAPGIRIPHVGWNTVTKVRDGKLWGGEESATCYHVHSYRFDFDSPESRNAWAVGLAEHGEPFVSMIEHDNVMGVQFHPEKSQTDGLAILKNFLKSAAC
jgi:glutamine amidotransferase